ncbi:MAG: type II secretion system protein GspG [Kiritimatiellae bacterium]|nr:type II secretion system protein GspG [Kiritimatiellia bacterium]
MKGLRHGRRPIPNSECGFTLVEVITVIAIIGVLAGLVLGVSGYAMRKADRARATADLENLQVALDEWRAQKGKYPTNIWSGGRKVVALTSTVYVTSGYLVGQLSNYVPGVKLMDPWGRGYYYSNESAYAFAVWSLGPDGLDAGDDIKGASGEF